MTSFIIFLAYQCLLGMFGRFIFFWLAIDQLLNVLIGSGWPDEALSAYAHRKQGWRRAVINGLFFWQDDHCRDAFYSEMNRRQLPPEYRS